MQITVPNLKSNVSTQLLLEFNFCIMISGMYCLCSKLRCCQMSPCTCNIQKSTRSISKQLQSPTMTMHMYDIIFIYLFYMRQNLVGFLSRFFHYQFHNFIFFQIVSMLFKNYSFNVSTTNKCVSHNFTFNFISHPFCILLLLTWVRLVGMIQIFLLIIVIYFYFYNLF